jgi:hypothetical protein
MPFCELAGYSYVYRGFGMSIKKLRAEIAFLLVIMVVVTFMPGCSMTMQYPSEPKKCEARSYEQRQQSINSGYDISVLGGNLFEAGK